MGSITAQPAEEMPSDVGMPGGSITSVLFLRRRLAGRSYGEVGIGQETGTHRTGAKQRHQMRRGVNDGSFLSGGTGRHAAS